MLTRMLFLLGLTLCGIVVLTGAWPGSFAHVAPEAETAFVAKTVPLDPDIVGADIDVRRLLEKAIAKLGEDDMAWLHTKIRQTGNTGKTTFVAEGFLQRGPNQCARLELQVTTLGVRSQLVTVSDGDIVAHVQKHATGKPTAETLKLPALSETSLAAREEILWARNCGGPIAVLRPIHEHLRNATMRTGMLRDIPVVQIKGDIDPAKIPICAALNLKELRSVVYLDATSLWPIRVEWWGSDKVLQVEFSEPIVGVTLSDDDCARLFSYHPDGDERVTQH